MIRDLVQDLIKYLPAEVVPAISGLIAVPIVTRFFPPEDYGNYILVIATVSAFGTILGWLGMSIVRFYPKYERDRRLDSLIKNILCWLFITVSSLDVLYIGLLFLARGRVGYRLYCMMLIGIIVFSLSGPFDVLLNLLRAKRRAGWYSGFSAWKSVASLGLGMGLILVFGFGVEGLLWGSALSMALALPFLWKLGIGRFARMAGFSVKLSREMARYSIPLVVGNLAAWILSLSDRYILEFFRGAHEVGIYSVSYAISEKSILLLVSVFMLAWRPIAVQVWEKEGEQKARDFVSSVTRYYLLVCIPAVAGLSVLARSVISVLSPVEYREGFRVIPFVALSGLLLGLQQKFQAGFIFSTKTHPVMIAIASAGLINIGLNLLLVPRYGYMAAAMTTLVGYIVLLAIMVISSRKYFIWDFPFRSLGRAVLSSAIMAAAIYPVGNSLTSSPILNLTAAISIGLVLYFALLILFGEIQPGEKRLLTVLLTRLNLYERYRSNWRR